MPWNDPNEAPFDVGDVITSDTMKDYVRDNLLELKDPPTDSVLHSESPNYSLAAGAIDFVDIDATDLRLDITPSGDTLMVGFVGFFNNPVKLDFTINGTRFAGSNGLAEKDGTNNDTISFVVLVTGLTPGTAYTLKMQWKSGGTYSSILQSSTNPVHFWAREVS